MDQLLKGMNHKQTPSIDVHTQRNPPDFGLAVFLVRDCDGQRIKEYPRRDLRVHSVLGGIQLRLCGLLPEFIAKIRHAPQSSSLKRAIRFRYPKLRI